MPATVITTGIVPILTAITNRLVAKNVVPVTNLVKWTVKGQNVEPAFDSQFDIVLLVGGFLGVYEEGGRDRMWARRRLDFIPRTRMNLDAPDRQQQWMSGSGSDLGYFAFEESVIGALSPPFMPQDAQGNHLACRDLKLLTGLGPDILPEGWGWGGVAFEVTYKLPLLGGYT